MGTTRPLHHLRQAVIGLMAIVWAVLGGVPKAWGQVKMTSFNISPVSSNFDGSILVGAGPSYWTQATGVVRFGLPANFIAAWATGISGDSNVIAGEGYYPGEHRRAFKWTHSGGFFELPLPSNKMESFGPVASFSGSIAYTIANHSHTRAVFWNGSGEMKIINPPGIWYAETTYAGTISMDGRYVFGNYRNEKSIDSVFRWSEMSGFENLGNFGHPSKAPTSANWDGSVIVGQWNQSAVRWSENEGVQVIGPPDGNSSAESVSGDGKIIAGYSSGCGSIWTRRLGWTKLTTILTDAHVSHSPEQLWYVHVSPDGNVLFGDGYPPWGGFRITGLVLVPKSVLTVAPEANSAGWHGSDATVTIKVTDGLNGAGIREVRYTVDGGTEQVVAGDTATFVLSENGTHTIAYYSIDNDGDIEWKKTATVRVDKAPSTTTHTVSPSTPASGWHKSVPVNVNLSATDNANGSGVKEIRTTVDMGSEQVVAGSTASVALSDEGIHSVAYWSVDNAGNVEPTRYATVKVDTTAPVIDASVVDSVLNASASDPLSGVKSP